MTLFSSSVIVFPRLDPNKEASQKTKRTHVCNVCSRAFKRSEHCIRHQRGHTQEKPFACRVCHRRYSRRDLLVRHERTLHTPEQVANAIEEQEQPSKKLKSQDLPTPESSPRLTDPEPEQQCVPKSTDVHPKKRTSDVLPVSTPVVDTKLSIQPLETAITDSAHDTMELNMTDFTMSMQDLDKMRTFPTSVPLPDLDGDLEFLDFFDPFLGIEPKQMGNFAFPPMSGNLEGWSPLEHFSTSSHSSMQDYGFQHTIRPTSTELRPCSEVDLDTINAQPPNIDVPPEMLQSTISEAASTPRLVHPVPTKVPTVLFSEQVRSNLLKDLSKRLPSDQANFRLPSAVALQKCVRTYVEAFHVHIPIFHLHTFDLESAPSPLLLAICAIGALYRLERKIAASLYSKADQALSLATGETRKQPRLLENWSQPPLQAPKADEQLLWKSQTRFLLAMFATFSGDPEATSNAIAHLCDFTIDFRQLAPGVKAGKAVENMSWEEWVGRESVKRLLYGHILYGNLVTMTYGIPPGYSVVSDGYIEMPCDQSLWDASTAEQWSDLVTVKGKCSPLSLRDAVSRIMYGNCAKTVPEECWSWSPFAVNVVINAVSIQLWHIAQGSYFFSELSGVGKPQEAQRSQTLVQAEAALSKCRALITQARTDADYAWTEAEGPLLFNCLALLRVSYCRAFTGTGGADPTLLLKESHEEVMASIEDFIAMPQERSELIARAVSRAFEGMLIPNKMGTSLLKKTAALTWAVEHALAGWDSALLVTKWVHVIEIETAQSNGAFISDLEDQTMRTIKSLLADFDDDSSDQANVSVAAKLARYWAGFYDDTWVWGVTPRMGWVLRELANCYESNSPVS